MTKTLVIGYGNPCRGDDGVGCHVVERLLESPLPDGVEVMAAHQLTPELAEKISHFDLVFFVDACWDRVPGRLGMRKLEPETAESAAFSHDVNPAALLGMSRMLYGRCPEARLFTVAGESFAHSEKLSSAVQACLPDLLKRIRNLLPAHSRPQKQGRPVYA